MTFYLLDTNIISDATRLEPSASLVAWLGAQVDEDLYISSISIGEIWQGILGLPAGKRRKALEIWFNGPTGPGALFAGRILSYDDRAALVWGRFMAEGRKKGQPRSAIDMMVAAIAEANQCIVVTDNEKDFRGIPILNPTRQA